MSEFQLNDASLLELEARLKDCPPQLTEVSQRQLLFVSAYAAGKNSAVREKRIWQSLTVIATIIGAGLLVRLNSMQTMIAERPGASPSSAAIHKSDGGKVESVQTRPDESPNEPLTPPEQTSPLPAQPSPPPSAPASESPQVPSTVLAATFAEPRRINLDAWQVSDDVSQVLAESLRRFQGMSANERTQTVIGMHAIYVR